MPALLKALSYLPELIAIYKALYNGGQAKEKKMSREEMKKNLDALAKALEEKDEKKLNDVFNSI